MSELVRAKSILAKLLAEENISVQHQAVSTAYFDLKKRLLVCPNWKDLTNHEYDLLLGHEVGHAKNTPEEGWHNSIVSDKERPNLRRFLNVIEDARIERIIKDRYPGLRPSFFTGYRSFHKERNFFGVRDTNPNSLSFIDRVNLHFKIGAWLHIVWKNQQEEMFVTRIRNARTFDEVAAIAREVYDYCKEERNAKQSKKDEQLDDGGIDGDDDAAQDDFSYDYEQSDVGEQQDGQVEVNSYDASEDDDIEEYIDGDGSSDVEPDSITDKNYEQNMRVMSLSEKSDSSLYYKFPKYDSRVGRVINYRDFYENYNNAGSWKYFTQNFDSLAKQYLKNAPSIDDMLNKLYLHFQSTHGKYVNYLVKQFELRKRANQFMRAGVAKTGELDMKKLHKYQLVEDLFKKVTVIPNAKNHGMFMIIDSSGSMRGVYDNTREQVCILAMFCKKVGIPFEVYEFIDNKSVPYTEENLKGQAVGEMLDYDDLHISYKLGYTIDKRYKNVRMQQILSSSMNSREFNRYLKYNLYMVAHYRLLNNRYGSILDYDERGAIMYLKPGCEELNGTPLDQALIMSLDLVPEFKRKYNVDILNFIILTDGEGDHAASSQYVSGTRYLVDPVTKINYKIDSRYGPIAATHAFLSMIKNRYDVRIIGFYLSENAKKIHRIINDINMEHGSVVLDTNKILENLKKNKFAMVNDYRGFEKYYFIPMDSTSFTEVALPSSVNDKTKLKIAFRKMQSNKRLNVKFLNHFMNEIV